MLFNHFKKAVVRSSIAAMVLASSSLVNAASDGAEKLKEMLNGYQSFSTNFVQVTLAENGREAQKTEGSLKLAKPNLFRWETQQPFPQEIVSDGQYIWIHDPDLEQVTRRSADSSQGSAPALILNGQIDTLRKTYNIRLVDDSGSEQLFDLQPLSDQHNFSRIRLAFANQIISEIMLEDALGQRTSVVFNDQELNPDFDKTAFLFRVPADADLIIDTEE